MNEKKLAIQTLEIKEKKTIKELLKELGLNDKFYSILVDGKRVSDETLIDEHAKIIILPKIQGG